VNTGFLIPSNPSSIPQDIQILDNPLFDLYLELFPRHLKSVPDILKGAARFRAILKTVDLFVAYYGRADKKN
jgi:hypothetical protein